MNPSSMQHYRSESSMENIIQMYTDHPDPLETQGLLRWALVSYLEAALLQVLKHVCLLKATCICSLECIRQLSLQIHLQRKA